MNGLTAYYIVTTIAKERADARARGELTWRERRRAARRARHERTHPWYCQYGDRPCS